jgi:hypothetical protein
MKTKLISMLFTGLFMTPLFSSAQTVEIDNLGQPDPGKTITKFAPGIISNSGILDLYVSFSPDGKEMFYKNSVSLKHSEYIDGAWQDFTIYAPPSGYNSVTFCPVEGLLYLWEGDNKLGYMTKKNDEWSDVKQIDPNLNAFSPTASKDSCVYFIEYNNNVNTIYYSKFNGETHEEPKALPFPINKNPKFQPNDPCISPEGDYIIFVPNGSDLWYVSFRKAENHWTYPKRLSDFFSNPSNVSFLGLMPKISPDGKYIFTSNWTWNEIDIFWVSTSIIEDARNSNFIPYVKNNIPDQIKIVGTNYNYTIPDSALFDDDGNETLTFTAKLSNGNNLPDFLDFDPETNTISGTLNEVASYNIKITATDTAGASVSDIFKLSVEQVTAIENINASDNLSIFPNPARETIHISSNTLLSKNTNYQLLDIRGKIAKQGMLESDRIEISDLDSGIYFLLLTVDGNTISKMLMIE